VVEQDRWLPVLIAIRLAVTQARTICPEISVEFSGRGWLHLQQAIDVRNRITHPKPRQSLTVGDADLSAVGSGMFWLVATVDYVMSSINLELTHYARRLRETVESLSAGDPAALAEYHAALSEIEARE
jgi:hypothetical protein